MGERYGQLRYGRFKQPQGRKELLRSPARVDWIKPLFDHPSGGQVYGADGKMTFAVLGPYDDTPATAGNGTMIGFALGSPEAVNTFHALAVQLGGRDEGRPGKREGDGSPFYMSYFRDLDGNKISAFHVEGNLPS